MRAPWSATNSVILRAGEEQRLTAKVHKATLWFAAFTGGLPLHYRAYFIDRENHIRYAHDLECETDAQAEARLAEMDRQGFAAELWRGAEKLLTFPRTSSTTAATG